MSKYQKLYFKRAQKVAFWLQIIPYVRAVFLTGSIARGEATKKSDIDFFIVTKNQRIYTCRALVTIAVQMMGIRRYGNKIAGRICLNRYQTENNLEIKPHNRYHQNDYSQAILLLDLANIEIKYRAANQWIGKFNNAELRIMNSDLRKKNNLSYIQVTLEVILNSKFGDWIEGKLKNYQKKRILFDPRTLSSPRGKIICTDRALCFHPDKTKIS